MKTKITKEQIERGMNLIQDYLEEHHDEEELSVELFDEEISVNFNIEIEMEGSYGGDGWEEQRYWAGTITAIVGEATLCINDKDGNVIAEKDITDKITPYSYNDTIY